MRGLAISAGEDLGLERKLAKKLKVKGGKLKREDDDISMIIGGIPSILDSFEDENMQLVGEAPLKGDQSSSKSKQKKYNKNAQGEDEEQEGEQKAKSTLCRTSAKATAEEVPSAGSPAERNIKYVAPQLRSHLGSEHAQLRRRLRVLLYRMSEANVESITSKISTICQLNAILVLRLSVKRFWHHVLEFLVAMNSMQQFLLLLLLAWHVWLGWTLVQSFGFSGLMFRG